MEISELKGLGPKKEQALADKGIFTAEDLLRAFPVDYEDRRSITPAAEMLPGRKVLVRGVVTKISKSLPRSRGRKGVLRVMLSDDTGNVPLVFFNSTFLERAFTQDETYYAYGQVSENKGRLQLVHPAFFKEQDREEHLGLFGVYPYVKGIGNQDRRRFLHQILESRYAKEVAGAEFLPSGFLEKYALSPLLSSYEKIHFPDTEDDIEVARRRFLYETMLLLQLGLIEMRKGTGLGIAYPKDESAENFVAGLSFALTVAQQKVLDEVVQDMESITPMNRLIQGDVGSGKTVIAQAALLKAAKAGYQGAYMMPTEILARQQYEELKALFAPYDIQVELLVSSLSAAEKRRIKEGLENGSVDVVVGTHALMQKSVVYANLGLAVTDEQHRFGVRQRQELREKGITPDTIVMSATPIPRTLAMVLFGDMDISVIDEMPKGRKAIKTQVVTSKSRDKVYRFVGEELAQGHQAFVVSPLIEESEALEGVRSATELHEEMKGRFPDRKVGLVHGGLSADEKQAVMAAFAAGDIDLLVATVVVEVGINVPNATVMVLENAERFGLSQMHQLRGRVGRSDLDAYCILVLEEPGETALARAKTMKETNDGFVIAEEDLRLRGPGEMFGERQHGVPSMQLVAMMENMSLFTALEKDAKAILKDHPGLADAESHRLREQVLRIFGEDLKPTL